MKPVTGCDVHLGQGIVEGAAVGGWRTFKPSGAGWFVCNSHDLVISGPIGDVKRLGKVHMGTP